MSCSDAPKSQSVQLGRFTRGGWGLLGMIPKKISTMFSQDPDVGVKCRVIRG